MKKYKIKISWTIFSAAKTMWRVYVFCDHFSLWCLSLKAFQNLDLKYEKMNIVRGLRVCLWRHLVVRIRNVGGLFVDLLLPCILFLILGLLNALFGEHFGAAEHKERIRSPVPLIEFGCLRLQSHSQSHSWSLAILPSSKNGTIVYFSPNNSEAAILIMAMVEAWTNQTSSYSQLCNSQS